MADDKDDNGLKKAEEALKKAEQNPAFDGPQDSPKFKAAAQKLLKARANFEAAGGVSGDTTAIVKPVRGLDTPPAPTAPTSPSDQVRNAMVGMRPEGNLGGLPQLPEGREAAEAGRIQTKAEVIAEETKKRQAREANQADKKKKKAADDYAQYKRNLARAAQQAKDESEHIRSIREHHEKDMPSFAEDLLAKVSGGMMGVLLGTFKREKAASEAAEQEITIFKDRMKIQADIRKGAATARNERAAGRVSSVLSLSEKTAIGNATNVLTSIAYGTKLFEDGKNPLVGIGPNTNKDTPAQVRDWWAKTSKKAFAGNKKAQREMGAASSRIADRKARLLPFVTKDDLIRDNKNTYKDKVYASVPTLLGEPEVMMDSISHIWGDEAAINKQIDDWETLKAYHQMFDALAASAEPDGEYADFAGAWADQKNQAERSDVLGDVNAMKDMAEKFKVTITAQHRNLKSVKDAGRKVADIKAKIAEHRKNGEHDTAERMEKNELPEAKENLDLTLAFSGHSDLTVGRNKDGSLKVSEKPDGESLIVQRLDPTSGKVIYALNDPYISSLPDELQPAVIERANRALKLATERAAYTPPALVKVDEVGGPLTVTLNEYDEWKKNPKNKKQIAALIRITKGIAEKVALNDAISFKDLLNGDAAGFLSDEENAIMRNRYVRMMILQIQEKADKIK